MRSTLVLLLAFIAGCVAELDAEEASSSLTAACVAGQWCVESPPAAVAAAGLLLHGVWAVSASDVFAVGDGGTILRRVNAVWTQQPSGTTASLHGVWAASSSDVWAVGGGGVVLRFDGTAWRTIAGVTSSDVEAVWGSSSTDVWLAGSGQVIHWNGTAFSSTGFGGVMLSVSGTGPRDVWVTGENTFLHHFTGAWATVNPGAGTSTFFAVLAISPTEVWATDGTINKETMHFIGGRWVGVPTGGGTFNGMSSLSASDIWGAGGSRVGHWNGTRWTVTQPLGTGASLWSVAATPGNAWVVGSNARIAHLTF